MFQLLYQLSKWVKSLKTTIAKPKEERKKTATGLNKDMQKTKDLATQAPQRNRRELRCFEGINSSWSTKDPNQVDFVTIPVISKKRSKGIEIFDINANICSVSCCNFQPDLFLSKSI